MYFKRKWELQIANNNVVHTGINERCRFNDLEGFHVTENICADVMHDVFQGICQNDLGLLLHYYIHAGTFSLDDLYNKIRGFHYGVNEKRNKPLDISEKHISQTT